MSEPAGIDFDNLRYGDVVLHYGREYRVVQRDQIGTHVSLIFESVDLFTLSAADIHGESQYDRMWRASKSFNGGQV